MSLALDSSVLVASLDSSEPFHKECDALLLRGNISIYVHALVETFSTLTGGRLRYRLSPSEASRLLRESILPCVTATTLDAGELMSVMEECEARGIRGGALYDFLHLAAARKVGARKLYTLNLVDFRAFTSPGDPRIVHP